MVNFFNTKLGELLYSAKGLSEGLAFQLSFQEKTISSLVQYLNTRNLEQGFDSDGNRIFNKYTDSYTYKKTTEKIYKETIGRIIQAGSNYTMKYSGDFWKSIHLDIPNLNFVDIKSDPIKYSFDEEGIENNIINLFDVYGEDIVGLQDRDYTILIKNILPLYIKYAREVLGIN